LIPIFIGAMLHAPNMNKIIVFLCFTTLLFTSCYNDADDEITVEGIWKLTAYNVSDGFDINNDGIASVNLLDEIPCTNNETLVFESKGVVTSNQTFNPSIEIGLVNSTSDSYIFNVICDEEGSIGYATNFTLNANEIFINDNIATISGNKLSRVFADAIKIYNEDFTEVVATKDVTLVYMKR